MQLQWLCFCAYLECDLSCIHFFYINVVKPVVRYWVRSWGVEFVTEFSYLLQVLLLCGPPGLGKTTLAHVAARHCGYHVVEVFFYTILHVQLFFFLFIKMTDFILFFAGLLYAFHIIWLPKFVSDFAIYAKLISLTVNFVIVW